MDNIVDAILDALNRTKPFHKDITSINSLYTGHAEIHMSDTAFLEHFSNYKSRERQCDKYPIELYVIYNGIKFFSIYSVSDFYESK